MNPFNWFKKPSPIQLLRERFRREIEFAVNNQERDEILKRYAKDMQKLLNQTLRQKEKP